MRRVEEPAVAGSVDRHLERGTILQRNVSDELEILAHAALFEVVEHFRVLLAHGFGIGGGRSGPARPVRDREHPAAAVPITTGDGKPLSARDAAATESSSIISERSRRSKARTVKPAARSGSAGNREDPECRVLRSPWKLGAARSAPPSGTRKVPSRGWVGVAIGTRRSLIHRTCPAMTADASD
jgi:hypothetical protein